MSIDPELLPPATEEELDRYEAQIDGWLQGFYETNLIMVALDRGSPGERRWYVRLAGEEKEYLTIWLHLGQRALHAEAYVLPAPEENEGLVYEQLLRRNRSMHGVWFAIGVEDALFLVGQVEHDSLSEGHLDRLIGSMFSYAEQFFRPALHLGFASRFR